MSTMSHITDYVNVSLCFLLAVSLLSNGQQVVLTMPASSSSFYCLNEPLKFTCSGSGVAIQWTVPSVLSRQGFFSSEEPPLNRSFAGGDAVIALEQTTPILVSTLWIQNVPDVTVTCSTNIVNSSRTLSLTSSTTPPEVQDVTLNVSEFGNLTVRWRPVNGTFVVKEYRIQLCRSNMCQDPVIVMCSSFNLVCSEEIELSAFFLSSSGEVNALVSAVTQCDVVGSPSSSLATFIQLVLQPGNVVFVENLTVIIILGVMCGILGIVSIIFIGLFSWKCCCNNKQSTSVGTNQSSEVKSDLKLNDFDQTS